MKKQPNFVTVFFILLLMSFQTAYSQIQMMDTVFFPNIASMSLNYRVRNDVATMYNGDACIALQNYGILRYNGTSWLNYNVATGDLQCDTVISIDTDSNNIAAVTYNGVAAYNGVTWNNFSSSNSPLPDSGFKTIEIRGTDLYIGTKSGLYIYKNNSWTTINSSNSGLSNDTITSIAFFINGDMAVGTTNGAFIISGSAVTALSMSGLNISSINDIETNTSDELYISTSEGTYFYANGVFNSITPYFLPPYSGCMSWSGIANYTIDKYLGGIAFFTKNPNNNSLLLCVIDSIHKVHHTSLTATLFPLDISFFSIYQDLVNSVNYNHPSVLARCLSRDSIQGSILIDRKFLDPSNLNINKVNTRINYLGDLWWDPVAQLPHFQVPSCDSTHSLYAGALWVGGYDNNNTLHMASLTYRQGGIDYSSGPLDTITGLPDSIQSLNFNRTWNIYKTEIDSFISNYQSGNLQNGSYIIPEAITTWPAHGTGNYSRNLAPFYDNNSDGNYNPFDGDYPLIDGDQELFFIFNDVFLHGESECDTMHLEIHGKAYAYNCPVADSTNQVINHTTFYNYKIFNRSPDTYSNCMVGIWVDPDLGNNADDYVGCNVPLNTGFVYNSSNNDQGGLWNYGQNPPVQSITVLSGPLADPLDGIDNDNDNIIDEAGERNMMNHFQFYTNSGVDPTGRPAECQDYYGYLNSTWKDDLPVTFGSDGRNLSGTACNFMFPGTTDPAFSGQNWTMSTAGLPPDDMRFIMSSGKFTLQAGGMQTLDFATIYTRNFNAVNWPGDALLNNEAEVAKVINWFNNGLVSCPLVAINENTPSFTKFLVYPNPALSLIHIPENIKTAGVYIMISDASGRKCMEGTNFSNTISIKDLSPGLYNIMLMDNDQVYSSRFSKVK